MSELDDFLTTTLARQIEAEEAIHNGDVGPRMEMWSSSDPVTLFGAAGPSKSGWDEVSRELPLGRVAVLQLHCVSLRPRRRRRERGPGLDDRFAVQRRHRGPRARLDHRAIPAVP